MILKNSLECDVVDACNLSCKDCSHISPMFAKNSYSFQEFEADINQLSQVLKVKSFTILGGEPLMLGEKLIDYVETLRNSGISEYINLVTNGLLLHRYPNVLSIFDTVRVSVYPHKQKQNILDWIQQSELTNIKYELINTFGEVFTKSKLTEQRSQLSWDECWVKQHCNTIYKGHYYRCFGSAKFHLVLDKLGIDNITHYGCKIDQTNLENRLQQYIDNKQKLSTCSFCLNHLDQVPWEEAVINKIIR